MSVKTALLLLKPLDTDSNFAFKSTILSFRSNVDVTKLSISELPVDPGLGTPPWLSTLVKGPLVLPVYVFFHLQFDM